MGKWDAKHLVLVSSHHLREKCKGKGCKESQTRKKNQEIEKEKENVGKQDRQKDKEEK